MNQYEAQEKTLDQSKSNQDIKTVQLKQNNVENIIQMAKINPRMVSKSNAMVLQRAIGNKAASNLIKEKPIQRKRENKTGMPDQLKAGVESLSGIDMSDVRVHYNSDKPAKVGALAYTKGTEIHVAPGQERHLPHEAWHVVQQAQSRVAATTHMKDMAINDDVVLEREADEMGQNSLRLIKNRNSIISSLQDKHIFQKYAIINNHWLEKTVQFVMETQVQKIIRILKGRKIKISDNEAIKYAKMLERGNLVQVEGHNIALRCNKSKVVSSIKHRIQANASNMRVSPSSGSMNDNMITVGRRPLAGKINRRGGKINDAMLRGISKRKNLVRIMHESAAKSSGIARSEWLHIIAHSLGGPDDSTNLVAGSHALNTAMIPFETLVKNVAFSGESVDYNVTFFTEKTEKTEYVHHVEIEMSFSGKNCVWTLELDRNNPSEYINGQVLAAIERYVSDFAAK